MNMFDESTIITIGNLQLAPFWHSPWLGGRKPKDTLPFHFFHPILKNDTTQFALEQDRWIANTNMS